MHETSPGKDIRDQNMTENQKESTQGVDPGEKLSNETLCVHKLTVTWVDAAHNAETSA